jgi:hypothetical protein
MEGQPIAGFWRYNLTKSEKNGIHLCSEEF